MHFKIWCQLATQAKHSQNLMQYCRATYLLWFCFYPEMASAAISENIKQERYKGQLYLQAHSGSTVAVYIRLMLESDYAQTVLIKSYAIKSTVTRQST